MTCIYCKEEITPEIQSIEHVFPDSFGCPDTWVLDCVCQPCNNRFGGSIEKWLASDSWESVLRLRLLGSQSGKSVRSRRMKFAVPEEEVFGKFQGARLERDFKTKQLEITAQAGFKNAEGKYEYFTKKELSYPEIQERVKELSHEDIKILGRPDEQEEVFERIVAQLKVIGIDFKRADEIHLSYTPPGG